MTLSNEALYGKALELSSNVPDNFLELANALRQLFDRDPKLFHKVKAKAGMGLRKAYYLVEISRAFDPLSVSRARLRAIGWTKLQILRPRINSQNAEKLLEQAESVNAVKLKAIVRGQKPPKKQHCVALYFSKAEFELVEAALMKHGGVRSGRGIQNKEEALLRFIKAAQGAA